MCMFQTIPLSHREFFTGHTAMVYVIQACKQDIRTELQFHPGPARKLSVNLYDIHHRCVYSKKLLVMDRETVWNMYILFQKQIWEISVSGWFYYKNLSRCTVTWTSELHIAWDAAICLWSWVYPHILQFFSIKQIFFPRIFLFFNCVWWDPWLAKPSLAGGYCNVYKLTLLRLSPVWLEDFVLPTKVPEFR